PAAGPGALAGRPLRRHPGGRPHASGGLSGRHSQYARVWHDRGGPSPGFAVSTSPLRAHREELANALTHGLGAAAALAGGAVLITLAAIFGNGWQLGAAIVFGVSLLLLYLASTLYHSFRHPVLKGRLKVFDHCAIYLLIAGTYTPFTLVGLRGPWGWGLFAAIWSLALAGVVFKLFYTGRFKRASTLVYV